MTGMGKPKAPTSTVENKPEDRPQGQPSTARDLLACLQPSDSSQRFTTLYNPCTVTYTANIECGTSKIQVPIASKDVSGPEKAIITSSLPKIWKWVHDKGLKDSVSLQAAFDLAHSMHEDESDEGSSQTSDCVPDPWGFDGNF
ncbi:hypothetical protein E8E13_005619 [Curvularia kusanoi]|uniref:Uncharacterized protein n=1 Tax=Curvularia kusanoi TaxID=90978 RepID=A0A9P4TKH8_CURKU|nr:hypothetical protein E8E13_005619 [Curvularia kusanoi]